MNQKPKKTQYDGYDTEAIDCLLEMIIDNAKSLKTQIAYFKHLYEKYILNDEIDKFLILNIIKNLETELENEKQDYYRIKNGSNSSAGVDERTVSKG